MQRRAVGHPLVVFTSAPSAWTANIVQDLALSPLTWTVHALQLLVSQPMCVPVKPKRHGAGGRAGAYSTSASRIFAATVTLMCIVVMISNSTLLGDRCPRPEAELRDAISPRTGRALDGLAERPHAIISATIARL